MTLLGSDFDSFFADAIRALKPYLDEVVCIGGCANALYRYHDHAAEVKWGVLGTKDTDVAVPQKIPLKDRPPIARLMDEIGLQQVTFGTAEDPVIKFAPKRKEPSAQQDRFEEDVRAVDLEFLCDLAGLSSADQERASVPVQEGLHAQPLRYLGMSLENTWKVPLERVPGLESFAGIEIQVPNPAAYVVSKILIRGERRKAASRMKDCFYMFEVSVMFRQALEILREEYVRLAPITEKWGKRFEKDARELFATEHSEGPSSAVLVYRDLGQLSLEGFKVTEEIVCRSVNRMLDEMTRYPSRAGQ